MKKYKGRGPATIKNGALPYAHDLKYLRKNKHKKLQKNSTQ
jgi:hypothetical protein